jgi:hypothetical protein
MKKIALAAALTLAATSVFAGSVDTVMMDPVVVEEAASSSAGGVLLPLIALLLLWAALA